MPGQFVNRPECLVLRIYGSDDPVRRWNALVGDDGFSTVRFHRFTGSFEAFERPLEQRIDTRREGALGKAIPVRVHDQLAVRGDDVQIAGVADHRLGDLAQHPGPGKAEAAGKDGDHLPFLVEDRRGRDQHHVRITHVGDERLRNDRSVCADRIAHVFPFQSIASSPVGSIWALGQLDRFGSEQEDRAVDDGEQAGAGVQVMLRRIRRSEVGAGDLAGAECQRCLQRRQLLVQVVGDAHDQRVLIGDHHVQHLRAEGLQRRRPDRQ